jgi:metallophosphoesterase superfamily enzyme
MIGATGASRLLVLGDLIHSGVGMTARMVDTVAAWRAGQSVRVELVPGNHDRHAGGLPESWRIHLLAEEVREGPLAFRHDPAGAGGPGMLCGHVHPMARLADLRLPCFVLGGRVGLLPAFSLFTRGLTIHPDPADRVFAVTPERVVAVARLDPKRRVSMAR